MCDVIIPIFFFFWGGGGHGCSWLKNTMKPELIAQILRKQFFCATDVHAIRILSLRFLCNWHSQEVPYGGARITRTLCNTQF